LGVAKIENSDNAVEEFQDYSTAQTDRLEKSNSGVDMQSYPLPMKLFTFWFRPLFVDSPSILGLFSSAENLVYLLLFSKYVIKDLLLLLENPPIW